MCGIIILFGTAVTKEMLDTAIAGTEAESPAASPTAAGDQPEKPAAGAPESAAGG
jgi:hypothetical protein